MDFENFTFPAATVYGEGGKSFTLKARKYEGLQDGGDGSESVSLVDTVYGDVTGDDNEEALVVLTMGVRGTAIPYYVYVYAAGRGGPKLLWSFYAGERGDGGLRRVYAEGGALVVELYGRDRVVDGGTSAGEDNVGVCCPKFYTRSRYVWRGRRFRLGAKESALPNPQGNAAYRAGR